MERSSDGRPSLFQINCSLSVQRNLLISNSEKFKILIFHFNHHVLDKGKGTKLFEIYSNKSPMTILNIQSILPPLGREVKEEKSLKQKCKGMELSEIVFLIYLIHISQL